MFIPGETVTHEFLIPFVRTELAKVIVTYKQNNRIVLTKTISSFEETAHTESRVVVSFSQQETLLFDCNSDYTIQLNVFTANGARGACTEFKGSTGVQHYKKVIDNG